MPNKDAKRKQAVNKAFSSYDVDYDYVMDVLNRNKKKNVAQRILEPDKYPVIQNEDGSVSSLLMSTATADGKAYAYPLIYQDDNGQLIDMRDDWKGAFEKARKRGDAIEFQDEKEAEWFTKNYKKAWR